MPVTLYYGKEVRHITVRLIQIKGAWKISEFNYGQDGKLSDPLK